jgi:hypothetical protein
MEEIVEWGLSFLFDLSFLLIWVTSLVLHMQEVHSVFDMQIKVMA